MILELSSLFGLIAVSALFSASETAFISLSLHQVEELAATKGKRGKLVKKLMDDTDTLLTSILIGNNLVNIGASAVATHFTIARFGSMALGASTGILTLVILIFAEVTPKRIAIIHNKGITLFMAYFIRFFSIVLLPVVKLISFLSSLLTGIFSGEERKSISLDGILHMVKVAETEGVVESYETKMVKGVFRFNDISIQAIMTHRTEVFSLDKKTPLKDALGPIAERGFSRIPVYEDNPEDIVGILLIKDVLTALKKGNSDLLVRDIMIEPIFVSGNRKINELFSIFKYARLKMAVIVDGYGGLLGIVTMEDITEELFGELYDEHEDGVLEKITDLGGDKFRILGDTSIHNINDRFSIDLPYSKNARTLGGFIIEYLGNIPTEGTVIDTEFGIFTIEKMDHNRINYVTFAPHKVP